MPTPSAPVPADALLHLHLASAPDLLDPEVVAYALKQGADPNRSCVVVGRAGRHEGGVARTPLERLLLGWSQCSGHDEAATEASMTVWGLLREAGATDLGGGEPWTWWLQRTQALSPVSVSHQMALADAFIELGYPIASAVLPDGTTLVDLLLQDQEYELAHEVVLAGGAYHARRFLHQWLDDVEASSTTVDETMLTTASHAIGCLGLLEEGDGTPSLLGHWFEVWSRQFPQNLDWAAYDAQLLEGIDDLMIDRYPPSVAGAVDLPGSRQSSMMRLLKCWSDMGLSWDHPCQALSGESPLATVQAWRKDRRWEFCGDRLWPQLLKQQELRQVLPEASERTASTGRARL